MHAVKTKTDKTTGSLRETIESDLVQRPAVLSFSGFTLESNSVIFEVCASTQPNAPVTPQSSLFWTQLRMWLFIFCTGGGLWLASSQCGLSKSMTLQR